MVESFQSDSIAMFTMAVFKPGESVVNLLPVLTDVERQYQRLLYEYHRQGGFQQRHQADLN